jgi:hypothetical protein
MKEMSKMFVLPSSHDKSCVLILTKTDVCCYLGHFLQTPLVLEARTEGTSMFFAVW